MTLALPRRGRQAAVRGRGLPKEQRSWLGRVVQRYRQKDETNVPPECFPVIRSVTLHNSTILV